MEDGKNKNILEKNGIDFSDKEKKNAHIHKLKKRANRCICKYCGSSLELRKITYAAYDEAKIEIYCRHCNRIEYGVEPLIYKMAEYYISEIKFDYYPELDESVNKHRMNVAMINNIISWGFKNAGLIDENGFTIPINVDEELLGEVTIISRHELEKIKKE